MGYGQKKNWQRRECGGPAAEQAEEHHGPGKVSPLVKGDAREYCGPGGFSAQRPIADRYRGDRHPVDESVSSQPRRKQLARDGGKAAADDPELDGRDPVRLR
jgi:hypothetical protein